MINVHSPVKQGSMMNLDRQYEINELVVRGSASVEILATIEQNEEELSSGMEVDLPSLIELCKRILVESGTLPKWFYIGVVVDAPRSQLLTYFSPDKDKFFSDIYNYIKEHLADNLPMSDTETVVKIFFERNREYYFNYMVIPLDSLITGSESGRAGSSDIRF
jgi:hypothetical protein